MEQDVLEQAEDRLRKAGIALSDDRVLAMASVINGANIARALWAIADMLTVVEGEDDGRK